MLILPEENKKKSQFRLRISENVYREINQYCEWAGIKHRDHFIEQACQYIFAHDADWKKHKENRASDLDNDAL